uniref:Uncharacterized protein n=1 Tax=Solanum lycopersicum TaxID=4081 RepID=K4AUJ1_SOLLC
MTLQLKKNKLDKRLKYIHARKKVSIIIYVATCTAVLIFSIVAASIATPRVASGADRLTGNRDWLLLKKFEFSIDEDVVTVSIKEIKKKMDVFMKNVQLLGMKDDVCSRDIRLARTVDLQRIIKPPNH